MLNLICKDVSVANNDKESNIIIVPENVGEFTPQWFELALKKNRFIGDNVSIVSAHIERLSDDTDDALDGGGLSDAQIMRVELEYGGETTGKEPCTVIAKWFHDLALTVSLKWRLLFRLMGEEYGGGLEENFYRRDIKFCREVLPSIKDTFRHPNVYYTGIIDLGNRSFWNGTIMNKPSNVKTVALMKDMIGWEPTSVEKNFLTGGLDKTNTEASLRNIAVLHGAFWEDKPEKISHSFSQLSSAEKENRGASHSNKVAKSRNKVLSNSTSFRRAIEKFKDGWYGHEWATVDKKVFMPSWYTADSLENGSWPVLEDPLVLEMLDVFAERYPSFNKSVVSQYLKKPAQTILHGDFHMGNHMYGVGDDRGKVVCFDFQAAGMGMVAVEIGYYFNCMPVISNLIPFAKVYHDALVLNGVHDYPWEEFKKDLLIQMTEFALNIIMECGEMSPEKMKEMLMMFGNKALGLIKIADMGGFLWPLIILTELYSKNKEYFLNEISFANID